MTTATEGLLRGVGISFDVLSEKTKRALKFFLRFHLEWFYRLNKQPSRIGRMMVLHHFILELRNKKK
ncbi:WecB/TagA/CpsF family glycosyltransferase [Desemzia sp. FAM 24101]|uniref:WecB/TagA/CpsF family glycosyltransferase n=1 Tax=unclassified Desemzia TaxID=2685243 RepID=UPI00388A3A54